MEARPVATEQLTTRDGLKITCDPAGGVTSLMIGSAELAAAGVQSGFLARDPAVGTEFCAFTDGACDSLGLALEASMAADDECICVSGMLTDTTARDRAITLMFALPIDAVGWQWHDDVRRARTIEPDGCEYINTVDVQTGADGKMSWYPVGSISDGESSLAIGLDMDVAAQYRISYDAAAKRLAIAYDFGLAAETDRFPHAAPFSFVIYRADGAWGFREVMAKFYRLFPDHFLCRTTEQGIWMPFGDVSDVAGWEDFGFKYHEGISNNAFDNANGILPFRYTEPSTWWMQMDPSVERTAENVIAQMHACAESDDETLAKLARTNLVSGAFDASGQFQYQVRDLPWCNGASFSSNPNPYIPGQSEAKLLFGDDVKEQFYGPAARGVQAGEYLDSLEAYATEAENHRREHFRYVTIPLTFTTESTKPVIHKAFSVQEFTKWLAADLHAMGKLVFANDALARFAFLAPYLDVLGIEVEWIGHEGKWNPPADEVMCFKRTLCHHKPYLLLLNTTFALAGADVMEKYFLRSLFYGVLPSMFSHNAAEKVYWSDPELYERDRHLFKRYMPLIIAIAEAGWEPVTHATTGDPHVYVERFGPDGDGNVYFTLLNDSDAGRHAHLSVAADELDITADDSPAPVEDMVSSQPVSFARSDGSLSAELTMQPQQVRLFVFNGR